MKIHSLTLAHTNVYMTMDDTNDEDKVKERRQLIQMDRHDEGKQITIKDDEEETAFETHTHQMTFEH